MVPVVHTMESSRVLAPLLACALAPLLIWLFRANANRREAASILCATLAFAGVLQLTPAVLGGAVWRCHMTTLLPGVSISFAVDGLSLIFALVAAFLWLLATFYNIGYMRALNEHAQTRYYFCFALAIFGALGVAFAGSIVTLYLFYEVITVCTYPLVAHHQDAEGYAGARKYLVYLMGSSKLFFLPAMALTYALCGTLDFNLQDIAHGIFPATANPALVTLTYALYIFGLAKTAIMPLHNWLPSAMVAPTPVSALLHAVAVVKAGVFAASRVMLSAFGVDLLARFGLGLATAYLAAFTILVASIIALTKDDIKARLAYSTVSQLSYILIGVGMLSPMAVTGGLLHIAHHAFAKITLFFAAGAIFVATGTRSISQMDGLGRRMPWSFGAFAIASLSMIGMPPACGFVSKWYLVGGAMQIHNNLLLLALLASTLLNASYFTPIIYRAFFRAPRAGVNVTSMREAPWIMVAPLCMTAALSLIFGVYPQLFTALVKVFTHE